MLFKNSKTDFRGKVENIILPREHNYIASAKLGNEKTATIEESTKGLKDTVVVEHILFLKVV